MDAFTQHPVAAANAATLGWAGVAHRLSPERSCRRGSGSAREWIAPWMGIADFTRRSSSRAERLRSGCAQLQVRCESALRTDTQWAVDRPRSIPHRDRLLSQPFDELRPAAAAACRRACEESARMGEALSGFRCVVLSFEHIEHSQVADLSERLAVPQQGAGRWIEEGRFSVLGSRARAVRSARRISLQG